MLKGYLDQVLLLIGRQSVQVYARICERRCQAIDLEKIYIYLYIYLCDFAKRCPLSFRLNVTGIARVQARVQGREKTSGLAVLLGVSREPRPRPIRGWVADLFCVKTRGVGRGDFFTLIRVSCQKAVQSQRIFPAGQASQINAVTHNHNTTSRAWGKWLTSHKLHGWGGWVVDLWTWLSRDSVQAPCTKSTQIYISYNDRINKKKKWRH